MIGLLSGRSHRVLTGVAVAGGDRVSTALDSTTVTFCDLAAAEIDWYLATGDHREQGRRLRSPRCRRHLHHPTRRLVHQRRRAPAHDAAADADRRRVFVMTSARIRPHP